MRIIHCADLHLDSSLSGNLEGEKRNKRKAEILHTFERMVEYAENHGVDAIVIAGDLFDTKRVGVTARNVVYAAIVNHPDITFFYLRGNHDNENYFSSMEVVPENLKFFNETWTSYEYKTPEGKLVITGAELNNYNVHIFDSLVLKQDCLNLVTLHGAEEIPVGRLRNKGIDYLALGHLHQYMREALDYRGVLSYSGCLEGRGYDECGEHGFVLIDVDFEQKRLLDRFIPFAQRNIHMICVSVDNKSTTPEIMEAIKQGIQEKHISRDDMVKIVLQGAVSLDADINLQYLMTSLEGEYYHVKITDQTRPSIDYSMSALDESLKGEFIRLVSQDASLDDGTKGLMIQLGIRVLAGEDMI